MASKLLSVVLFCLSFCAASVLAAEMIEDSGFASACCVLGEYEFATGLLLFRQNRKGGPTHIAGVIANMTMGKHGWHVHKDPITNHVNPCSSAGGHFNPFGKNHGAPDAEERHVGDLGNFVANEFGVGVVDISDSLVSLVGPLNMSVLGRTMVIHADEDDLGLGGDEESLRTGNAGARVGCCIITSYDID